MKWWHIYLTSFLVALILSLIITPLCKKLAKVIGLMDSPQIQNHKTHKKPTPLLGGVAIFLAWFVTIAIGFIGFQFIDTIFFENNIVKNIPGIFSVSGNIMFICFSAFLSVALGLFDDKFNMSAKVKLTGQILIAIIAVSLGGIKISLFILNPFWTFVISVFWILLIINAINFFDNMDGLAVGTSTIITILLSAVAILNQQYFVATLGLITTGATMGFWVFNHSPASIFMGDAGSHFLGYILAVLSASVTYYKPTIAHSYLPILIPLFILSVPLFDAFAVVVIRLRNKKPIYIGDNNHISHRFLNMGMTRRRAVYCVHLLTLIIGLGVLPVVWGDKWISLMLIVQSLIILLFISKLQHIVKK